MNISIATATFYHLAFHKALELIKQAGFEYIELDTYWQGGDNWEVAQHLKGLKPREVLKMVKESGLKISSLHDMGGVIYKESDSLIASDTYEYLEYGATDIPCIVFHTPHKRTDEVEWWERYKKKAGEDLRQFNDKFLICIENMSYFDGYKVPLVNPKEMIAFAKEHKIFINIDTTHYAEVGIDIVEASNILKDYVRCIHLSDYIDGKRHLYVGEGNLDLRGFFKNLSLNNLHALTFECNIPYDESNPNIAIQSMREVRDYTIRDIITDMYWK